MSQEELAYTSDTPISQTGRIERGETNTTISTSNVLSNALEVSVPEMFNF